MHGLEALIRLMERATPTETTLEVSSSRLQQPALTLGGRSCLAVVARRQGSVDEALEEFEVALI